MANWNYAEWAERNGRENLKARLATGDHLLQQANTLLSLGLVAIGGLLAYGMKVFNPGASAMEWGAAWAAAYLMTVCAVLTAKCIVTKETQMPFNEPANIYKPEAGLSQTQVLEFEMEILQGLIVKTKARNDLVATWLDRSRYAALFTPAVFAASAFLAGQ